MPRIFACFVVLIAASVAIPASAPPTQQKAKGKKKDAVTREETSSQDYANLSQLKDIDGKITDLDAKAQKLTLTIEWSRWEPNPNYKAPKKAANQQAQLMKDYYAAMSAKNPIHQQQALMRFQIHLQQLQAQAGVNLQNMFQIAKSSKDFELTWVDDIKIARAQLERKYNDEGELIKYTADELKKMKSKEMPSGYTAVIDDMRVGQSVKLYLKPPPKKDDKKKTDTAKTDKSDTTDTKDVQPPPPSDRPQVRMVYIQEEDIGLPDTKDPPKNKKKG